MLKTIVRKVTLVALGLLFSYSLALIAGELTTRAPKILAGYLTLLVILAVIGVPILVGYIIFYLKVSPRAAPLRDIGDYGIAWLMGITVIIFTTVIIGGTWLAIYGTYSYILNLLGG